MLDGIFNRLPKDLKMYIWEYDPNHRERLNLVLDELVYTVNWTYCSNDMCECDINILDENTVIESILGLTHYFCNSDCLSYGEWSIRYDYRKMKRRNL